MSSTLRWGDLPIIRDTESGIAAIEREQMTKPRPLEVEGPLLYQPSTDHFSATKSFYDAAKDDFSLDARTQHTLQLLQYSHQLTSLIEDAHHQIEQLKSGELSTLNCAATPPLPTWQPPKQKHPTLKPFTFIPDNEGSLFVRGIRETTTTTSSSSSSSSSAPVCLDATTSKLLLRRSVAAICAHAGFDSSTQSVLDTLTDVCEEYYDQLLTLLRSAVDTETYHGGSGFPDAITRVFYEMGIGSLSSVYDFYQSRVVNYHASLLQKCVNMRDEYEQMRKPKTTSAMGELNPSKSKDDTSSSVIHFPSTDEADETGDMEHVDQLEDGLGLDMSISQESSTTLEEESNAAKWKSTESAGNAAKHEPQNASEDRLSSSESCLSGGHGDAFHLSSSSSHPSSDSKRTSTAAASVISPPAAAAAAAAGFILKPPLKKFKK